MTPFCNNWVPGTSLWQIGQIHLLYPPHTHPHEIVLCIFSEEIFVIDMKNVFQIQKADFSFNLDPIKGLYCFLRAV